MAVCKAERRGSDLKIRRSMMCIHLFLENIMCAWCIRAGGELIPLRVVSRTPTPQSFPLSHQEQEVCIYFLLIFNEFTEFLVNREY